MFGFGGLWGTREVRAEVNVIENPTVPYSGFDNMRVGVLSRSTIVECAPRYSMDNVGAAGTHSL